VVGTPHLGASTFEASRRVGQEVVEEVISGLRGQMVKNAINIPALTDDTFSKLQAFIGLVEQMGTLYREIRGRKVHSVNIVFAGKEIDTPEDAKILSVVALKGILEGSMSSGIVNFVNANYLAEQNGIKVSESISFDSGNYRNLIRIEVTEGDGKVFVIAGTLLDSQHPRIVQIDHYSITFIPEGTMAYVPHRNVPGVIGWVATTMGEYNVNISKMVTATVVVDGTEESIMMLNLDGDVPQAAIDKCLEAKDIHEVRMVHL
jgi:D-3-phosphoglycerate dehydrogenase